MGRKAIKITVSEDMYNEVYSRSQRMSISMSALVCYILGEKLDQMKLAEGASLELLREIRDDFSSLKR